MSNLTLQYPGLKACPKIPNGTYAGKDANSCRKVIQVTKIRNLCLLANWNFSLLAMTPVLFESALTLGLRLSTENAELATKE